MKPTTKIHFILLYKRTMNENTYISLWNNHIIFTKITIFSKNILYQVKKLKSTTKIDLQMFD